MICQPIPYRAPVDAAEVLRDLPGFAFLDGGGTDPDLARYAYIGVAPFGHFTVKGAQALWNGQPLEGGAMAALASCLARYQAAPPGPDAPPFCGGAIGHLSYDLGQLFETLPTLPVKPPETRLLSFGFYDLILAFDQRDQKAWVCSSGWPEVGAAQSPHAKERAAWLLEQLEAPPAPVPDLACVARDSWVSNFTPQGFRDAVCKVQDYIRSGDIYQANIAQRFQAPLPKGFDDWAFYKALRRANPAPFAAFLRDGDTTIASSSPERFVSLNEGLAEARPIKGTARRSDDPAQDAALAAQLSTSEKDRAENVMIVDLLRNDLSRICQPGTVKTPVICGLETYAAVHHLTSVVQGQLREGKGPADLIEAAFPGGSITGAPKIRAMEIIAELEGVARGIYCGGIGYIGFDGRMDLNIAIRTAVLGEGCAVVQAGGGLTLLSDPEDERKETLIKAEKLFAAFEGAQ